MKKQPLYAKRSTLNARSSDLLFEIGTEEIPAAYLDGAIVQLWEDAERCLREAHVAFKMVEAFGTPRRLVLWVRELASTQHHPPEEIRGPSKQASFDAAGKPTPALTGFLKSRGGTVAQTKLVDTEKGSYIYLLKPARQVPTISVLPQLMTQLVTRLTFPKTMRWDDSGLRFARPIRWHVVLYGSRVVPVRLGRLMSGRTTWVGGPKRPRAVSVTSPAQYFALLKRAGVIVDPYQRAGRIDQLVKTLAKQHGGVPAAEMVSHGLLDEVSALVEQPVALVGQFDPKYLALPREVLLASMAKYQRVFAIQSRSGQLLPKFVAILDGTPRRLTDVRRTFEFILNARLADSLMFWNEDRKRLPLERLVADLSGVTFHERLGSMADKTKRLEALAETLIKTWKLDKDPARKIRRAATLAKADLVTRLVREFPTLQGIIGKRYALESKEDDDVAIALEQQYFLQEETEEERQRDAVKVPGRLTSFALTIIEKYDTVTSYFGIGIEPTGNADPFGLRPRAQGIVETARIIGSRYPLPLTALFRARAGFAPFQTMPESEQMRIASRIQRYILDRLYTLNPLWSESHDVIDAVLASPSCDDLTDVITRIEELNQLRGDKLSKSAKIVERTHNILKTGTLQQHEVQTDRLNEPPEQRLWERYAAHKEEILGLIERKDYIQATERYGEAFFESLHEFFDKVMVNVPDEALRQNRLALMKAINVLYTDRIADLSKLTIVQPRPMAAQV